MICIMDFDMFFRPLIVDLWPTFKMLTFLEYIVFFGLVFFFRTTLNDLYNGF